MQSPICTRTPYHRDWRIAALRMAPLKWRSWGNAPTFKRLTQYHAIWLAHRYVHAWGSRKDVIDIETRWSMAQP